MKRSIITSLPQLTAQIESCTRCARLTTYRREVAATKRRSFAHWNYWGRPVGGWGDPAAKLWIIGLAPAAHGANRTGRIFTGDRSGDFLFAALHRAGVANQPHSLHRDDGLQLTNCFISATVRCAPPGNKPTPEEERNCSGYLDREWDLLIGKRVILALGSIAWKATLALAARKGCPVVAGNRAFGHGAVVRLNEDLLLVGSYHVSQQNTFTGRLTPAMFDAVLARCQGEMT